MFWNLWPVLSCAGDFISALGSVPMNFQMLSWGRSICRCPSWPKVTMWPVWVCGWQQELCTDTQIITHTPACSPQTYAGSRLCDLHRMPISLALFTNFIWEGSHPFQFWVCTWIPVTTATIYNNITILLSRIYQKYLNYTFKKLAKVSGAAEQYVWL